MGQQALASVACDFQQTSWSDCRRGTEFAFIADAVRHAAIQAVPRGRDGGQSAVALAVGNDSVCMSAISIGGPPGTHHDRESYGTGCLSGCCLPSIG